MKLFKRDRTPVASDISAWRRRSSVVRLLLVDDDEDDAKAFREHLNALAGADVHVDWAPPYEDGLEALMVGPYDICIVDYQLGPSDGVELVRAARNKGWRKPVLMLTGQRDRSVDLAAMDAGATDFLVKEDIDAEKLERSLRYAVALGDAYEQLAAVNDVGKILTEQGPTPEALDQVLGLVVDAFRHDKASIYFLENDRLILAAQRGYPHTARVLDPGTARLDRVIRGRRAVLVPNHTVDPDDRSPDDPMEFCVPLNAEGEVFGILNVAMDPKVGAAEHSGILTIADRIAVALALNRAMRSRSSMRAETLLDGRGNL